MPTVIGTPTTVANSSSNTVILSKPSGVTDGELLLAVTEFRNTPADLVTSATPPSGWTKIIGLDDNGQFDTYYKPIPTASAESATTYTFTTTQGASRSGGLMVRVTGVDLSNIVDAVGSSSSTQTASGITTVGAGAMLAMVIVTFVTGTTPATTTAPSGMTKAAEMQVATTSSTTVALFTETRSTAGATGTRVETQDIAGSYRTALFSLTAVPPTNWTFGYSAVSG